MFPGAELTEDSIERHFRIVRRKGEKPPRGTGKLLRQFRVKSHGEQLADEIVERLHARPKDDLRLGVFPSHDQIVWSHSVRDIVAAECRVKWLVAWARHLHPA